MGEQAEISASYQEELAALSFEAVPVNLIETLKAHYRDRRVDLDFLIQEGCASDMLITASTIRRNLIDMLLRTEGPSLSAFQQVVLQEWADYLRAYVSWLIEAVF